MVHLPNELVVLAYHHADVDTRVNMERAIPELKLYNKRGTFKVKIPANIKSFPFKPATQCHFPGAFGESFWAHQIGNGPWFMEKRRYAYYFIYKFNILHRFIFCTLGELKTRLLYEETF